MRLGSIFRLIGRDVRRTRGALATAGFGILAGTAALFFFLSLGLGVRSVLLGQVFPLDKIELEPKQRSDPGLLALMLGSDAAPGIAPETVQHLRALPQVSKVFPKLRFAFPSSARGGAELFGHDVGTAEMMGDGVEPSLVADEVKGPYRFEDPWKEPGPACQADSDCQAPLYCERPSGAEGKCVQPVPVLVSRYLVELFNKGIAPAHGLPPVGESLLSRASSITFQMRLGESLLGKSRQGSPRNVRARVVGISSRAIDLGMTLPLETVRRWNQEYGGLAAASSYSAVLVEAPNPTKASAIIDYASQLGLVPKDTRARDISVLINGILGLLTLVCTVILLLAASNIAYLFRALLAERRGEIGLYRAVGASKLDIQLWLLSLALLVGTVYAVAGVLVGWAGAHLADWLARTRIPDFPFKPDSFFSYSPWLMLATVVFGALFALLGAAAPTRRAASASPRDALTQPDS